MKRVIYLVVAALVSMAVIVAPAAAQGEQAQEWVQQAQTKVDEARQYMETPEGQAALEEARANLEQALQDLQGAAQEKMQEVTSQMEKTSLVKSGGVALSEPGFLLPAAALLLGGSVLGYAVLRRR
jgi:hypothetical protein